ncbi:MAG TPA: amidohydrolase family protein [archaeon]|nr:amidohydrolase family protein [archaeon]
MQRNRLFPVLVGCVLSVLPAGGRVQVFAEYAGARELPVHSDVYQRIKSEVDKIRLIDTHEHLVTEKLWLTQKVDFFYWFSHYSSSDLVSAGMPEKDQDYLLDAGNSLDDRWKRMAPYWPLVKFTGYGQALRIAARDLYGIEDINESTWRELSAKISEARKPGYYDEVLQKRAGIDILIHDQVRDDPYLAAERPKYFVRVKRLDNFISFKKEDLESFEKDYGVKVRSLGGLLAALDKAYELLLAQGYIGIKSGLAYSRILRYDDTTREEAALAFKNIISGNPSPAERKPFEDFMMHEIVCRAGEHDLPVQIHTGLQEGNGNIITNSRPTHLVNLFMKYPGTRFDIFHGSFPYMGELATLAKNFQNVYLNMCWMPVISPTASRLWLRQWLETVPVNKIMAFGGDYLFVEGTYGHSVIARRVVTETLTEMVESGYLSEGEAVEVARRILRQNAIELFRLERFLK